MQITAAAARIHEARDVVEPRGELLDLDHEIESPLLQEPEKSRTRPAALRPEGLSMTRHGHRG